MNDDIEWQGPKFQDPKFQYTILDPRCGDWVEERCENGSVLTGITENTLKISSPLPGMAPQEVLSAVVGICQPVKSKTQAKPVVGKITLEETTIDAKVGLVGYRRPAMCPLGTIVAGIKYSQTDQFDHCDGDTVVPSVELDCVSLKDGSHYATGSAGQNFFEYDWNDDLSVYNHPNRVDFFPGFGAHALRVWTIENRQNFLAGFRFDQTPVDLPRKENAVWTGSHKEYSFLSAKAGGDGGNEKVISCPDHQVLTGVNFWVVIRKDAYRWKDGMEQRGVTEVLNGIESIRCSRVNVE
jgi:hypothetical protein